MTGQNPALPRTMTAVRLFEYGEPSVLQTIEAPLPEFGPNEVLPRNAVQAHRLLERREQLGKIALLP